MDEKIEVLRAAAPLLLARRDKGCVRPRISSTTFDNSSRASVAAHHAPGAGLFVLKIGGCPEWRFHKRFLMLATRVSGSGTQVRKQPATLRKHHSGLVPGNSRSQLDEGVGAAFCVSWRLIMTTLPSVQMHTALMSGFVL